MRKDFPVDVGLVLILIVVTTITMMILMRDRRLAREVALADGILSDVRELDAAKEKYALENKIIGQKTWDEISPHVGTRGMVHPRIVQPRFSDMTPYLKKDSLILESDGMDRIGNPFIISDVDVPVRVNPETKKVLVEVTGGDTFWGPYS